MKTPKLSIIIPAYNREDLIQRALDSVPTSKDYEIILVNDGSTDKTLEIMQKWLLANKRKFHKNSQILQLLNNEGVATAMNNGFDFATGEYIVSLSSDDYYVRDFSEFMPYLDGKNDLVYFDLEINDGTIWHLDEKSKEICVGAVKFIRRAFLGDTRVPNLKYHEDKPFSEQLYAKNPKEVFTGIVLKHYNFPHEGSLSWQAEEAEKRKQERFCSPSEIRLSIIIPAYIASEKGLNDLKELIKKIVHQKDFTRNQLIVIDDGSTVKEGEKCLFTEEFIHDYFSPHDELRYINPNSGVAWARNLGIVSSKGDYIVFIDADDDVPDNFMEILEDRIDIEDANGNKNDIIQFQAKHEDGNIAYPEPCAWGKLIKRSWIGEDRFDEDQLIGEEDTLFHKEGKEAIIDHDERIIYYHRQSANPDSLMKRFWRGEVPRRRNNE